MAGIVVLCAVATFSRADQFSSPRRLWESTREVDPACFAVYNNLGADAQTHGRIPQAEAYYREALRLEPRSFSASNCLANVLRMQGKWRESANLYQAILHLQPDAQCYNNLGVVYLELNDVPQARAQFHQALALDPAMVNAYLNLYRTEKNQGRFSAAADALRGCLRIDPANPGAMTNLAALSLEQVPAPSGPEKAGSPVFESTVALAERACQLTGYRNPQSLAVLSKALFASGHRAEAIAVSRKALALAVGSRQVAFANDFAAFAASMGDEK